MHDGVNSWLIEYISTYLSDRELDGKEKDDAALMLSLLTPEETANGLNYTCEVFTIGDVKYKVFTMIDNHSTNTIITTCKISG